MKTVLLLALLTVAECGVPVVGGAGQSATLPCFYDRKYHGALSFCWVRGQIPSQGCGNQLVSSDGTAGTPASSRYQLLGRLDRGDVSMTILNLTEEDAGAYGCRVEIPGWFNDQKHQFMLTVTGADLTTGTTLATETPAANQTEGLMISTETVMISCGTDATDTAKDGSEVTAVLVFVLFMLVVLVTAGGLFIYQRRWRRPKVPRQLAWFTSVSAGVQLQHRGSAEENVYQIEDGGVYESCP
ncbi:hepatitis A virus cellular receptor 2 homolog isoform 1-T1 [Odontesthes bonariensis]|uniref:hepatitis A virus cellular receptor 2 homolog isoform X1 n=1 Tax=Odontesthes bonariensis TaxID=219752 RepID=UPI003F58D5F7